MHVDRVTWPRFRQVEAKQEHPESERDTNAINQSLKTTREGSIVEIGNVPIFVGSESCVFEKGRLSDGGAMIGVINAIIYGRLRATPRPPRLRADTRRSDRQIDRTASPSYEFCSSFKLIICSRSNPSLLRNRVVFSSQR